MEYNKDERPAPSINEQPRQLENGVTDAATLLQTLQKSPFTDEDNYLTTSNLCKAIFTIADTIGELVDDVIVSVRDKREVNEQSLLWTKERIWQIRSIAEVIDDRLNRDFEKMMEIVCGFGKSTA